MQEYPKWLYHKSHAPKLVQSKDEHKALGSEWAESPAEFKAKKDENPSGQAESKPEASGKDK